MILTKLRNKPSSGINEYELLGKDKKSFDLLFEKENPWKLDDKTEQLRYKIYLKQINKLYPDKKINILELGCAEGNFTSLLSNQGYCITAVDISEKAIERARNRKLANVDYIVSDMLDYISNNDLKKYDVILLFESLCYLNKSLQYTVLKTLRCRINIDALVLFSTPVRKFDIMFPSYEDVNILFEDAGYRLLKKFENTVSLRGRHGLLASQTGSMFISGIIIRLYETFWREKINQKMFVFEPV